jgi:ribonuclease HI
MGDNQMKLMAAIMALEALKQLSSTSTRAALT